MSMCRSFVLACMLPFALGACGSKKNAALRSPTETLDAVLAPDSLSAALQKAGGGHFHGIALFRVEAVGQRDTNQGKPASPPAVTTLTDVWIDRRGNFRLLETNDQDGGREIVRVDREIAVALRYGKLVKRTAQDAESARFLAEALGAPRTAWELVRGQVDAKNAGGRIELGLGRKTGLSAGFSSGGALQRWRDSIVLKSLAGNVSVSGALPTSFECTASFRASRDSLPIEGEVAVSASIDQLGQVPDLAMPEAETLHLRQRTILEERALLGGICASATVPPATKRAVR